MDDIKVEQRSVYGRNNEGVGVSLVERDDSPGTLWLAVYGQEGCASIRLTEEIARTLGHTLKRWSYSVAIADSPQTDNVVYPSCWHPESP